VQKVREVLQEVQERAQGVLARGDGRRMIPAGNNREGSGLFKAMITATIIR
jgi:hypothetical protein